MKTVSGRNGGVLTPWQPGQSGNPKGMPKGYKTFVTQLKEACHKTFTYKDLNKKPKKMRASEGVATMLLAKAIYGGDLEAAKIIIANVDSDLVDIASSVMVQNNYTQNNTNTLGLSDKQVLKIAAILEEEPATDITA